MDFRWSIRNFKASKKDKKTKELKKSDKDRKLILHGASLSRWGGILNKVIGSKADFAKIERSKFKSEPEISDKTGQSADFTRYYMSNNISLLALCDVKVGTSKKQKHDGLGELDRIVTTRKDTSKYNDSSSEQLKTLLKKIKDVVINLEWKHTIWETYKSNICTKPIYLINKFYNYKFQLLKRSIYMIK